MPKMVRKQMKAKLLCLLERDRFWYPNKQTLKNPGICCLEDYLPILLGLV